MIFRYQSFYTKLIFSVEVRIVGDVTVGSSYIEWGLTEPVDDLVSPLPSPVSALDRITLTNTASDLDNYVSHSGELELADLGLVDSEYYDVSYKIYATGTVGQVDTQYEQLEVEDDGNMYINYSGPDNDSFIYFHDGSSATGKWLQWADSYVEIAGGAFNFNASLVVDGDVYIKKTAGDPFLGFGDAGSTLQAYLIYESSPDDRFAVNKSLRIISGDLLSEGNAYLNWGGGDADSFLYFYNNTSNTGAYLQWDDSADEFVLSDGLSSSEVIRSLINIETQEPTGILSRDESTLTFVDATKIFQILPVGATFTYYIQGQRFTSEGDAIEISDDEGMHYIYIDSSGDLQEVSAYSEETLLQDNAFVATIYWDTTNNVGILIGDERHGIVMDWVTHEYLHDTFGCRWESGLALADLTNGGNGSLAVHAQFGYTAGTVWDEDLNHSISADSRPAQIPIFYMDDATSPVEGVSHIWRRKAADDYPLIYDGAPASYTPAGDRAAYNLNVDNNWSLAEVPVNQFFLIHYFATNDPDQPVIGVLGQNKYSVKNSAREAAPSELLNIVTEGLPTMEFKALATVVFQTGAYANVPHSRTVDSDDSGGEYIDWRFSAGSSQGAGAVSHGGLAGLADDDHQHYVLADGTRSMTTLNVDGAVQCDSLRIDQAPEAIVSPFVETHYVTINLNGVVYRIPCEAD